MEIKAVGIPYKGSKRKLIKELNEIFEKIHYDINQISEQDTKQGIILYDLFGGGGSVSFSLAQNPIVEKVIYNELDKDLFDFIMFLKNINQEEFFERFVKPFYGKDEKPENNVDKVFFERCYTFGNGGSGYLYNREVENFKRNLHHIIIDNDENHLKELKKNFKKLYNKDIKIEEILEMGIPKNIDEVQAKKLKLNKLMKPYVPSGRNLVAHINNIILLAKTLPFIKNEKIEFHNKSYIDFKNFESNSIVYLDPPYQNTSGYDFDFDFSLFEEFITKNKCVISEYNLEHKDYEIIYQKNKNNIRRKMVQEKIYAHKNYNYTIKKNKSLF